MPPRSSVVKPCISQTDSYDVIRRYCRDSRSGYSPLPPLIWVLFRPQRARRREIVRVAGDGNHVPLLVDH
ncbi:MAG: hypothetical protein U0528_09320 [Anaerolineae bacterium]